MRKRKVYWVEISIGIIIGVAGENVISYLLDKVTYLISPTYAYNIEYTSNKIEIVDRGGEIMNIIVSDTDINKAILTNIDKSGNNEIVAAMGDKGPSAGYIICYTAKGDTNWICDTYDKNVTWDGNFKISNSFSVIEMQIEEFFSDGKLYLVAIALDMRWFTSRVLLVDLIDGNIVFSYWHSGHLGGLTVADLDKNGTFEIILSGYNNGMRRMFDTDRNPGVNIKITPKLDTHGQSYPGIYKNLDIFPEDWYLLATPPGIGLYSTLEYIDRDNYLDVCLDCSDGRRFYLNYRGELIDMGITDGWRLEHDDDIIPMILALKKNSDGWEFEELELIKG